MRFISSTVIALMLSALAPDNARSQNAEEIIRRAEDLLKGKSCKGTFVMKVATPDYTREMRMDSWWVGNEKALIVVRSPKKEAGNKTLKIKNEMWSYLKNTEMTIKIPPSMMLQSWNGSDFTNDDLVRESNLVKDYFQRIVATDTMGAERCWTIELTPKPEAPVVWGRLVYWVRQKDGLSARVEYFDERDKLMRVMVFSDYKQMGGRMLPARWTMVNSAKPGHQTEFNILTVSFDIGISDRIFSFQELEKGN
jgi:outer membrane lipoprotein-sorting protein